MSSMDFRSLGLNGDVVGGKRGAVIELDIVVFADDFAIGNVFDFIAVGA